MKKSIQKSVPKAPPKKSPTKVIQPLQKPTSSKYIRIIKSIISYLSNLLNISTSIPVDHFSGAFQFDSSEGENSTTIWIYDISQHKSTKLSIKWSECDRYGFTSLLISNNLYLVGGGRGLGCMIDGEAAEITSFDKINIREQKLTSLKNLPTSKEMPGVCSYRAQYIYSLCGKFHDCALSTCERYIITKNEWQKLPKSNEMKHSVGSVIVGDSVYMIGGVAKSKILNTIEKLSILKGEKWLIVNIVQSTIKREIHEGILASTGNNQIIVTGKDAKKCRVSYIIDAKSNKVSNLNAKLEGEMFSASVMKNGICYSCKDHLMLLGKDGNMLNKIDYGHMQKNWKLDVIKINEHEEFIKSCVSDKKVAQPK